MKTALDRIYDTLEKIGVFYWLAVPTLLVVDLLGACKYPDCGKPYTDFWMEHPEYREKMRMRWRLNH